MKIISLLLLVTVLFSCASYKYDSAERTANNTLKIKTNIPDAKVKVAFELIDQKEETSLTSKKSDEANYYETNYTFNKLKFGRTFLEISKQNYETKTIKVWRLPRAKVFGRSFLLGCFTFMVPIGVDAFRSDFYKVASFSDVKKVNLKYSQDYMEFQFKQIENSTNPIVFNNYIQEFPYSNYITKAIDKKDSTELLVAVNKSSESAIDQYILYHKNSKFLKDANSIKSEMVEAKTEFEKVKVTNNVAGYEQFLTKYPRSLQRKEAHLKLIDAAEKVALASASLDKMIIYYDNYLLKFKEFLDDNSYKTKNKIISQTIDNQIIVENNPKKVWNYEEYSKLWKKYIQLSEKYKGVIDNLEKSVDYRVKISNELLVLFNKLTDEKTQKEFLTKATMNFEKLSLETDEPFVTTIFDNSNNKNGIYKLYNAGYIPYKINHTSKEDPLRGKDLFSYKGNGYKTFTGLNYEECTFTNDKLIQIKLFNNKIQLCDLKYYDGFTKLGEASYFLNGKLVRTEYTPDRNTDYFYEFENGVNLSFKELEEKIKGGDNALAKKDYDNALDIYTAMCKNDYPATILLNLRIKNSIANATNQKAAYLQKLEQERLAEERRQEVIRQVEEKKREKIRLAEEKKREKIRLAEEKKREKANIVQSQDQYKEEKTQVKAQSVYFESESDVISYMAGKVFYDNGSGMNIKYGYISSYGTYGIKITNKNNAEYYFINVNINAYGNSADLEGISPTSGDSYSFRLFSGYLIVGYGESQTRTYHLK